MNYSLILKQFDAAEDFIKKFVRELDPYYMLSTENLCLAMISYYKREFGNSLSYLTKVKNDDISYKLQIKVLTIMIYFSANETESFYSMADSFKHFVNSNKLLSPKYEKLYPNFINFTARLYKGIIEPHDFDLLKFKEELISANNVAKKHWLIEKVNDLQK